MPTTIVSQVAICNSALFKVGADRISTITQDTRSAIILNNLWNLIRDEVLRAHPWKFALKRATLNVSGIVPDSEFDFQFQLPSDCLRVLNAPDNVDAIWTVEGGYILTNDYSDDMPIRYIYRNEDWGSWDSNFAEAMAWRLAQELAYPLTQSLPLQQECNKQYKANLAEARSMNGMMGIMPNLIADTWTNSRK